MIIGLVRHFKVKYGKYPKFYHSKIFERQLAEYDISSVEIKETNIKSSDWDICFCSTLPRAIKTANAVFNKEIVQTELLIEVPLAPFTKRNIHLPYFLWVFLGRIAWGFNGKSQPESRIQTEERIVKVFEMIKSANKERVLIVSHGFFLSIFARYLKKKGFNGAIDETPRNGKLYIFGK